MIRFLADADLNEAIVSGCLRREPAMDFISANDAKLAGAADPEVLRIAAEDDRILVTHDFRTMPRHFGEFVQASGYCRRNGGTEFSEFPPSDIPAVSAAKTRRRSPGT